MSETVAYFVTWTCYGTWLPGDARGWMDWHQGWKRPNSDLEAYCKSIMTEDAVLLSSEQRQTVEKTVRTHCEIRQWHLWALNCRTTHAHVVVTANLYAGEDVRDQLKAWCTRKLKEDFKKKKKNWK